MSLFNITSIRNLFCSNLQVINLLKSFDLVSNFSVSAKTLKNYSSTLANNPYNILRVNSHSHQLNLEDKINGLADQPLISPSFFTRFINRYWQETIFISKSNILSEKYINQLKSDGIIFYGDQYKKFLFDFSKALIKGRIITYLNEPQNFNSVSNSKSDVKYIWRKGFNFLSSGKRSLNLINNYRNRYLSKSQINLIKRLKCNKLPIFTVTNNLNQMVIAEPSDELVYNSSFVDLFYQWCYSKLLLENDTRPTYEGLFFVNLKDALEYKQYIKHKYINYNLYSNQESLNVTPSSLDFYYKLSHTFHSRLKFYLVPDLEELGSLIYNYQYYKNIVFHKKQKYGKYYFQGQPIYIIQPIYCRNKNTKVTDLVEYLYSINKNNSQEKYTAVFMNYKVALVAWEKFLDKHKQYSLPNKPRILVYNLEDFLNMQKESVYSNRMSFLFVPNSESYKLIKLTQQEQHSNITVDKIVGQWLYMKVMIKRFIWSLTSRQPIH